MKRKQQTPGKRHDVIEIVEAVYDLDRAPNDAAWFAQVLERLRPVLDHGMGVCCYLSDAKNPFQRVAGLGVPDGWDRAMHALMTS